MTSNKGNNKKTPTKQKQKKVSCTEVRVRVLKLKFLTTSKNCDDKRPYGTYKATLVEKKYLQTCWQAEYLRRGEINWECWLKAVLTLYLSTFGLFTDKIVVLNNVLNGMSFFSILFFPPQLVWQRSNKKPLYVYQIWRNDSVTPQNLEITFTFGSQPDTRENVPCHLLFISKKTLWFGGLPSQSSITTHLHWIQH